MRHKRAPIVTDPNNPTPQVGASLPRGVYNDLMQMCERRGVNRSALMRDLIIAEIEKDRSKQLIKSLQTCLSG